MYIFINEELSTLRLVRLKGEPFERSENQRTSLGIDSWDLSEAKIKDTLPLSNHRYKILSKIYLIKRT